MVLDVPNFSLSDVWEVEMMRCWHLQSQKEVSKTATNTMISFLNVIVLGQPPKVNEKWLHMRAHTV